MTAERLQLSQTRAPICRFSFSSVSRVTTAWNCSSVCTLIFSRSVSDNIKWQDIERLFVGLGAEITEGAGARAGVRLFGERRVFHQSHPVPETDKGAARGAELAGSESMATTPL